MNRRKFLRHATHSVAIPGLVSSFGFSAMGRNSMQSFLRLAQESNKVLVLIYLQGGNDGLNTVVPLDQLSALNNVRPHVILPDDSLLELPGKNLGLHPELKDLRSLYFENRLGIIQYVGYPEQNFSHFRSTDIWMSGSDSNELINTGWTGRVLSQEYPDYPEQFPTEEMPDPLAIEIGYGGSLLFQGPTAGMSMVINNTNGFYDLVDNVEEEAPDSNAGDKLRYVRLIARQSQQYGEVVTKAAQNIGNNHVYYHGDDPSTDGENPLSQQLKIVSKLIAGGLKTPIYLVSIGGFDTHDAQVLSSDHTQGEHADLLKQVNGAIMSFMRDLEHHGTDDRVLGMTISEFGRRIVSNASLGTDHGSAAPMFVFGNGVKGGVIGTNPVIDRNTTYADNLEMQFDFRQLNASVLQQWFGMSEADTASALLGNYDTLDIIGDSPVISGINPAKSSSVNVYPNPMNGVSYIDLLSDGKHLDISLMDLQGRHIKQIYSGKLKAGPHTINWDSSQVKNGRYFVVFRNSSTRFSRSVIKI